VNNFLKNRFGLIIVAVAVVLIVVMLFASTSRGRSSALNNASNIIMAPMQKLSTRVSLFLSDRVAYFTEYDRLKAENEKLKQEIAKMSIALANYDDFKQENELLRDMVGVRETNPDYRFEMAQIISREPGNWFGTFTINKGTVDGVKTYNPVITAAGLVGYVSQAGTNWAKVSPITDSSVAVGAIVTRSREVAVVEGDLELSKQNLCKLSYLQKDTAVIAGDRVETSGLGGVFPEGIMIGTVQEIKLEPHGLSKYAVIQPSVVLDDLRDVFVITSFAFSDEEQAAELSDVYQREVG
jgi:rod shape-determining protein MreC